ncbi:putative oxidoreductase [Flavobacterium sp. 2755]|uniref:SDR family oxidoreductase n=1 Tax=Flavobacterium sp. 2755 TaxID=2817765 RepID=UPI0028640900|nr:SDR family NAD(P)-dependent oxidoreductase [Flavobacterium sp. 2755]MDR6764428.1 putative oxidoreductase [Flavobacterium sp. 2755]
MILKNNVILITGGTSGLGLEMAKRFVGLGNQVIVCSRDLKKLEETKKLLPSVKTCQCDISNEVERIQLYNRIMGTFPKLNVLINNSAIVYRTDFMNDGQSYEKAVEEINTNLIAPIHLSKLFLSHLSARPNAALINITTGLIYVPRCIYPFYNATKSALHSFTQTLRHQLQGSPTSIIEVLFPAVNTPWHAGAPPKIAISAEKAIDEMILGIGKGNTEIKVAGVKKLYLLSRLLPKLAFKKINALE